VGGKNAKEKKKEKGMGDLIEDGGGLPVTVSSDQVEVVRANIESRLSFASQVVSNTAGIIASIHEMLKRAVTQRVSASAVLIGLRGSGKTMAIKDVIARIKKENKSVTLMDVFLSGVRLTNEQAMLEEFHQQLARHHGLCESDLSSSFGHLTQGLEKLIQLMSAKEAVFTDRKVSFGNKVVVLVLDELDKFCSDGTKQALIYSLLEGLHTQKLPPIVLLGTTCRLDALELMEKRVRSRFSQRQIHFFNPTTVEAMHQLVSYYLTIPEQSIKYLKSENTHKYVSAFARENLKLLNESPQFKKLIFRLFHDCNDVRFFQDWVTMAVDQLNSDHPFLTLDVFSKATELLICDPEAETIKGISQIELALLVAMMKLEENGVSPYNFQLVYDEYLKFSR